MSWVACIGAATRPRVALLPWGDVFEDWLDPLGITPEVFRDELTGSWMFGYVDALRAAGVDTSIVCITTRVAAPERWTHRPTGATLHLLPPGTGFAPVARRMLREPVGGRRDIGTLTGAGLRHVAPYLATPVVALARLLRAESCAAVLCQEYETPRFDACIAVGRLTKLPVFATFQGGDYQDSRLERPLRSLTIGRAAGLIVATTTEIERIRTRYRLPAERIAQIFNPVDVDLWHPRGRLEARAELGVADDAQLVVWHGQLQLHRKGLDVLLDAWAEITRARPGRNRQLMLVGAGADASEVRRRIADQQPGSVRLLDGWLNDRGRIAHVLSAADVYAFPSRHEGFPLAPIEAMACGLPVVAADAQGIADILDGGEAGGGVIVPRDDPRALASELAGLLDDGERRRRLGGRARLRAEAAFSLDAVGGQLRRVLLRERQ